MAGIFNKTFFRFLFRFTVLIAIGLFGAFASNFLRSGSENGPEAPQAFVGEKAE